MKPNHPRSNMMSAFFVQHQKRLARCIPVLSPLLRHVNTSSLASILFVAFALLSTSRGKEPEIRASASAGTTKSEVVIDNQHDDAPCVATRVAIQPLTFTNLTTRQPELLQASLIMPEACLFISRNLPACSIIRPTGRGQLDATGAINSFIADDL